MRRPPTFLRVTRDQFPVCVMGGVTSSISPNDSKREEKKKKPCPFLQIWVHVFNHIFSFLVYLTEYCHLSNLRYIYLANLDFGAYCSNAQALTHQARQVDIKKSEFFFVHIYLWERESVKGTINNFNRYGEFLKILSKSICLSNHMYMYL